jgi:hypothetical protein
MADDGKKPYPPGFQFFHQNRNKFPPEELLQYSGQYVAWSPDGTRIITSAATEEEMEAKLVAAGVDPSQVMGEYIYDANMGLL